ncbi:MAG TPA: glycosyltransferase family 2 protein [Blastocatellia bacterium]|nr:glycosyltransferase family 2 protein [Blastocatellia bacterium]
MEPITIVMMTESHLDSSAFIDSLEKTGSVYQVILLNQPSTGGREGIGDAPSGVRAMEVDSPLGTNLRKILDQVASDYALLILPGPGVVLGQRAIERFLSVAMDTGAAMVYSDFLDDLGGEVSGHPLIDYQAGSIRDSFDFGSVLLLDKKKADEAFRRHGNIEPGLRWGGLYELRLKLSTDFDIRRIPEPLYTRVPADRRASGERQFDYVDPRQRDYQIEMESVATRHLKRIGAYLPPEFAPLPLAIDDFPLTASVVIPVRNRERTVKEAVLSALSQKAPFDFNVIVVDNHSTDRTTEILSELSIEHENLVHVIPKRRDLGIGGCWNVAVYSDHCGRYAVQLDSDDLYSGADTLEKMIAKFNEGPYAMVIGSYKIVDFDLNEIPPGLIDHREWTRENGRNNALRINGLGAPRGFFVPVLRQIGLPNTSYGEDYAAALRISRSYEIGRVYEPVYYARRWEGNSDAALALATSNRYDSYKDGVRTIELLARKRTNNGEMGRA